jgi:hypothetical protein
LDTQEKAIVHREWKESLAASGELVIHWNKVGRFVTRQRIALEQSSSARAVLINRFTVKFANCDAVRSNPAGL